MKRVKKNVESLIKARPRGSIFILSAPSGTGKTTLCKELCRTLPGLKHSISHTTRPRRKGERNNIHYFFTNRDTFQSMINRKEFAEWAMVFGNLYGTSKRHLEETISKGYDIILDIDVNGAAQMRSVYKDAYFIFILPPSMKVLRRRLGGRSSDTEEEIQRRLSIAADEISCYRDYDYVVVNDRIDKAICNLSSIVRGSRCKTEKLDGEVLAKLR